MTSTTRSSRASRRGCLQRSLLELPYRCPRHLLITKREQPTREARYSAPYSLLMTRHWRYLVWCCTHAPRLMCGRCLLNSLVLRMAFNVRHRHGVRLMFFSESFNTWMRWSGLPILSSVSPERRLSDSLCCT